MNGVKNTRKLIISKVKIFGENVEPIVTDFFKGLNIVSGPSDTGKTYFFQLIDYLLGKENPPKKINEANGYKYAVIELESGNNLISFVKNLSTNDTYFAGHSVVNISEIDKLKILSKKHTSTKNWGISNHILDLLNSPYKTLRKNNTGGYLSFTFRHYAHQCMIDENNIFSDTPYFFAGQGGVQNTPNKESLLTVLSGIDDSCLLGQKVKLSPDAIKGQVLEIERQLKKGKETLDTITRNNQDVIPGKSTASTIDRKIDERKEEIHSQKSKILHYENERSEKYASLTEMNKQHHYGLEIVNRIGLLEDNYQSDLKRIDFIDQANYYLEQVDNFPCPICGSETSVFNQNMEQLINLEHSNLVVRLEGLSFSLADARKEVDFTSKKIALYENEIAEISNIIEKELQPVLSQIIDDLERLITVKSGYSKVMYLEQQITELENRLSELGKEKQQIKNDKITNTHKKNLAIKFDKLNEIIESLLNEWGLFNSVKVQFDETKCDLVVNDKEKSSFGKGFRALINSAFAAAILIYTNDENLPFPSFLIIDSPLIAFSPKKDDDDHIPNEVKERFYKSLENRFVDSQVIIFENLEPAKDTLVKYNHIRFTKNPLVGRPGLYPSENRFNDSINLSDYNKL